MAPASKARVSRVTPENLKMATASATDNVLRLVIEAKNGADTPAMIRKIARLTRLCEEAADHMSAARRKLHDGAEGGDAAIDNLGAALKCLRKVESAGARRTAKTSKPRKRQRRARTA